MTITAGLTLLISYIAEDPSNTNGIKVLSHKCFLCHNRGDSIKHMLSRLSCHHTLYKEPNIQVAKYFVVLSPVGQFVLTLRTTGCGQECVQGVLWRNTFGGVGGGLGTTHPFPRSPKRGNIFPIWFKHISGKTKYYSSSLILEFYVYMCIFYSTFSD